MNHPPSTGPAPAPGLHSGPRSGPAGRPGPAGSIHRPRSPRATTERTRHARDRSPGRRDERGITTAEYAVGTAAGAGFAGLLYQLLTGGFGDKLLKTLFDHVLGLLGIG